jgi:hypothetical protein
VPDVTVAVLPLLSVMVSITDSGWATPSLVLVVSPQISVNETVGLEPLCVTVFVVP